MLRTMKTHLKTSAGVLALCLPALALAQSADPSAGGHPTPPLHYQSAFADYKPWQDIERADWRAVNDTVGGASAASGGHAGHGTAPAPATSAPATTAPSMRHHDGHPSHGGAK